MERGIRSVSLDLLIKYIVPLGVSNEDIGKMKSNKGTKWTPPFIFLYEQRQTISRETQ